jgi:2-dehydro-3-deoxy-D-arabinonate dehydratase
MSDNAILVRTFHPERGARLGVLLDDYVHDVSARFPTLGGWLRGSVGRVAAAIDDIVASARQAQNALPASLFDAPPRPDQPHWLAPVEEQDVWAAGVTYERSREARQEEAIDGGDIYARVYTAQRPELLFKAHGWRVIGPFGDVGIRADATWSVPEPELAVVLNPALEAVGFAVGNDMCSRDIEGANPLYLPQAKIYKASCALGPGIVLRPATEWPATTIRLTIERGGAVAFAGEIESSRLRRTLAVLIEYLGRSAEHPEGVVLLTGTGIVPPSNFTLEAGDVVTITMDGIGTLRNTVKVV